MLGFGAIAGGAIADNPHAGGALVTPTGTKLYLRSTPNVSPAVNHTIGNPSGNSRFYALPVDLLNNGFWQALGATASGPIWMDWAYATAGTNAAVFIRLNHDGSVNSKFAVEPTNAYDNLGSMGGLTVGTPDGGFIYLFAGNGDGINMPQVLRFSATNTLLWAKMLSTSDALYDDYAYTGITYDPVHAQVIVGHTKDLKSAPGTINTSFVTALADSTGSVNWTSRIGGVDGVWSNPYTGVDGSGNVYVVTAGAGTSTHFVKLNGSTGASIASESMSILSDASTVTWTNKYAFRADGGGNTAVVYSINHSTSTDDYLLLVRRNSSGTVTSTGRIAGLTASGAAVFDSALNLYVQNPYTGGAGCTADSIVGKISAAGSIVWAMTAEHSTDAPIGATLSRDKMTLSWDEQSLYFGSPYVVSLPTDGSAIGTTLALPDGSTTVSFISNSPSWTIGVAATSAADVSGTGAAVTSVSVLTLSTAYIALASTTNLDYAVTAPFSQSFLTMQVGGYTVAGGIDTTKSFILSNQKGNAQASFTFTSQNYHAAPQVGFFGTYISAPLTASASVGAGNIAFYIADAVSNTALDFTGGNPEVYIWRPSTNTVVGHVVESTLTRDSMTLATLSSTVGSAPATNNTEKVSGGLIATTAVSALAGDVIIVELWGVVASSTAGTPYTGTVYLDGTTENTTNDAGVSNYAAYIQFAETLALPNALKAAPVVGSTAVSALTATSGVAGVTMAAAAAAKATGTSALTQLANITMAAAAAATSAITAALSKATTFATAAAAQAAAAGAVAHSVPLASATAGVSASTAALTDTVPLTSAATGAVTTTSALTDTIPLATTAAAVATMISALTATTGAVTTDLATAAAAASSATAVLTDTIPLAAAASTTAASSSALTKVMTLATAPAAAAAATSALTDTTPLASAAAAQATTTSALSAVTAGVDLLAAAAVANASSTSALTGATPLTAAGVAQATSIVALAGATTLATAAVSSATTTTALSIAHTFTAAANAVVTATTSTLTVGHTLAATAAATFSTSAALAGTSTLAAAPAALATTTSALAASSGKTLAGSASAASSASASLFISQALATAAAAQASTITTIALAKIMAAAAQAFAASSAAIQAGSIYVPEPLRTIVVAAEHRDVIVPSDPRSDIIPAESRTLIANA